MARREACTGGQVAMRDEFGLIGEIGDIDQFLRITTDETLRETVPRGTDDFPLGFYDEDVYVFDFHCIDWHWHSEIELVYLEEGTFTALIGADKVTVNAGQALFINSQVIHRFEAEGHAIIPNIVFSPDVIASEDSLIFKKYIIPVLNMPAEYILFDKHTEWMDEALSSIISLFKVLRENKVKGINCEFKIVQTLMTIWELIYNNCQEGESDRRQISNAHSQGQLQIMMQFIQDHYREHISLNDIAETVSLGTSSVLKLFKKYLHISPIEYLIQYRIKNAVKFLDNTDDGIALIAANCGFDNIGYFCRKFKAIMGVTPSQHRKKSNS